MADIRDESTALNTDFRILKALCALHKVRVAVNDCGIEGKKKFVKIRVAYEAAQVLHRVLHTEKTEHELRQAERRFKSFDERLRGMQSRASIDTDAIKSSMHQLAHWLAADDKERPELESLLVPYVARTFNPDAPDTGLEPTPLILPSEQFTIAGARAYASLPWCPTIILSSDAKEWVEIRCPVCMGNTSPDMDEQMLGVEAMLQHLIESHHCKPISKSQVVTLCQTRVVKMSAVRNICNQGDARKPYVKLTVSTAESPSAIAGRELEGLTEEWSKVDWAWGKHPQNVISAAPHIVMHPVGRWFLLACPVCHGNSSAHGRMGFLGGPRGFYDHLRQGHGEAIQANNASLAAIIERCQVRELTRDEVMHLKSGSPDAIPIKAIQVKRTVSGPLTAVEELAVAEAQARDLAGVAELMARQAKRKTPPSVDRAGSSSYGDRDLGDAKKRARVSKGLQAAMRVPKKRSEDRGLFVSEGEEEEGDVAGPPELAEEPVFAVPGAVPQKATRAPCPFIEDDSD
ncbi:hypothetical protein LTR02_014685 [Friedmanniomyces endolithicus]|nr:hypothetical protein LTR94_018906 [Friedmanniomyces endolithicus]KAK0772751.1 hypothetical protein LTR59_015551 [Friedmanniomyces endolithicus]KAK0776620.1 hypothetical protein LTR38_015440 [Friedmanniomyces endolithicus]KAK0779918.1 hypothetical protein LTR75_015208 [Friedmanniomyces endolithicus]KAK0846622.1 hypothetical protein LTS02_014823 [Friedmanniomyces endolithicus]